MATIKRKILVRKSHINNGSCGDPYKCPVALALKAAGFKGPQVLAEDAEFEKKGLRYIANLPKRIQNFIDNFDGGKLVKPTSFVLRANTV